MWRDLLRTSMWMAFLLIAWRNVNKLRDGQLARGYRVSQEDGPMPAVTLCLDGDFREFPAREEVALQAYYATNTEDVPVDLWSEYVVAIPESPMLIKCFRADFNFTMPMKNSFVIKIGFALSLPPEVDILTVTIQDSNHFLISGVGDTLGSEIIVPDLSSLRDSPAGSVMYLLYSMERTMVISHPSDEYPCTPDESLDFGACLQKRLQEVAECDLGSNPDLPACRRNDMFDGGPATGMGPVMRGGGGGVRNISARAGGCPWSCTAYNYKLREEDSHVFSPGDDVGGANLSLVLIAYRKETPVIWEYPSYDLPALTADMGGFLGLLVGASLPSIYDISVEAVERLGAVMK